MIRTRTVGHLRNLQKRFPVLAASEIVSLRNRDYRYRLVVPKEVWIEALSALGAEQEWTNFKNEVARFNGRDKYERALHDVWRVM